MIIAILHYHHNGYSYDVQLIDDDAEHAMEIIEAWNGQNEPGEATHTVTILCDTSE